MEKVRPLLPKEFKSIHCIPAYGLQTEEFLSGLNLRELKPSSADEFRNFWLLYIGLKASYHLVNDKKILAMVTEHKSPDVHAAYDALRKVLGDMDIVAREKGLFGRLREKVGGRQKPGTNGAAGTDSNADFKQRTGMSIVALLEKIDILMRELNSLAWIMLDKLDLLFIEDVDKLKGAITGLIQLLVQFGNQFTNIQFKIFIRNDLYRQLHIVNKSHLVSCSTEMKWRGPLLMKLLVARAIVDPHVKAYCEEVLGEKVDVTDVILKHDGYVKQVFYALFEPTMSISSAGEPTGTPTHQWLLKRIVDGLGNSFPREIVHLGNLAVEKQRELNRLEGKHTGSRLLSSRALKEAFVGMSAYRCDTYLYAEFPHLAKHFDVFRGSESSVFHREELYMLFQPLIPKGDDAIRAVHDVGLLIPLGKNVDASREFKVPLLYQAGLGIINRKTRPHKPHHPGHHDHSHEEGEGDDQTEMQRVA
jgi:hypothetical protein